MADNVVANAGAGGSTFATDDIGGVHYPRGKTSLGADGAATDAIGVSAALDSDGTGIQAVGVLGQFDDTATAAVTENQFAPVRISSRRALLVEGVASGTVIPVSDGGGALTVDGTVGVSGTVTVDGSGVTQPVSGTVTANLAAGTNNIGDVDVASVPAPLSTTGGGTEAAALRVTLASDSTGVLSVDDNGGALTVDGTVTANLAAGTNNIGDVDVLSVVPGTGATALGKAEDGAHTTGDTGVYALAVRDDAPAAHSGTDGDYESLHVNAEGGLWVSPTPSPNGGLSIFRSIDLDETEEDVKTSPGAVFGMWVTNTATATRWLKFYNATAANTTVGTTTPVLTIGIPGNSSDDISGNFGPGGMGIAFDTAICVAATTGVADNDTGAPGANEVIVNIFYK